MTDEKTIRQIKIEGFIACALEGSLAHAEKMASKSDNFDSATIREAVEEYHKVKALLKS